MAFINPGDEGSATSTAHAATINSNGGQITTESLTTAHAAEYTMTVTDANISAASVVVASVANAAASGNTTAPISVAEITPAAGSCTINILNGHASAALNGKIVISYAIVG